MIFFYSIHIYVIITLHDNIGCELTWAESSSELFWSPVLRRQSVRLSVCKLFTFSSSSPKTTGPISTKLCTKYPWVKGIQVCSNEGPCPFPRGDNYEIVKIHWQCLEISYSRTTGPISIKLGTKHPWVKRIQVYSNEGPHPFSKGI